MEVELGASHLALKRLGKGLPTTIQPGWESLMARLRSDPQFVVPDKRQVWRKAWPDVPNHRHADLADGWRCCWTVKATREDGKTPVTVLFIGTHKEYDRLYGFATS